MSEQVWTTQDGRKIKISELSNDHLANIAKMLKKKGWGAFFNLGELYGLRKQHLSGDGFLRSRAGS